MAKAQRWQETKRETAYHKYTHKIEKRNFVLPNGEITDFYIRVATPGASVLALTPENQVITLAQYRPGPDTILRELPGGMVEKGEDRHKAAERELLEETGYAGDVDKWICSWFDDAYSQTDRSTIIIRNCKKVGKQKLDIHEAGEIELVDLPDFIVQVRAGQLTDTAGAMLALDHLGLL